MKSVTRKFIYGAAVMAAIFSFGCKQTDQIVDQNVTPDPIIPTPSVNELFTYYGSPTDPTNAQSLDAMWAKAEVLSITATVPNPAPPKLFQGYWGNTHLVDLKSIVDTSNNMIYFLVEYTDNTKSFEQTPFYFDKKSRLWKKESNNPVFDTINGILTRKAFNEDKFSFLFNISSQKFATQSCYGTCHTYYSNASLNSGTGNHWTENYLEKVDQWHFKMMQTSFYKQCSDEFQDDGYSGASPTTYNASLTNGRHVDEVGGLGSKGPANNQQSLKCSDKPSLTQTVPLWIYLNPTGNQNYYVLDTDTLNTSNVKIILAVDSMGVLSYGSTRGGAIEGTIDPNATTDYEQRPNSLPAVKAFASILVAPLQGSRADVGASIHHDGSKWHIILSRKLKTNDLLNQDVDFLDRKDKLFGIGVFDQGNNQHAIAPGLILRFKKETTN
jgi:hypothetical protein